jgi:hypothetical protein
MRTTGLRQRDGIERAKSKGDAYKGRKPTIDRSAVRDLINHGSRRCDKSCKAGLRL